jgi:hypothetical protein
MAQTVAGEQEQASGAIEEKEKADGQPYPPSWVDRLTDWVERLPVPAWVFYLGVAVVLALTRAIISWVDGSYPVGTFFPVHILITSTCVYSMLVVHYLDDAADAALADLRPVLNADDAGYERLRYQITTMPARPVLAWSIVGLVFGLVNQLLLLPEAQRQSLKLYTSPAAFANDSGLSGLNWMMVVVIVYHTIHQLRLVSRIYTERTKVNILETGPLYALSRVTALTAVAILFSIYLYFVFWGNWQIQSAPDLAAFMAFPLLAIATFVWPLWGAHRLLQKEKAHWKGEVARRMKAVTDKLHHRVDRDDMQGMADLKDALDGLVVERGVLDKVSTWPWEPETLRVVVTALLLPVVIWIITRVLERLGI